RWQPPVFAPVAKPALWRALWAAGRHAIDPRPALAATLSERFQASVVHLTSSGTAALQIAIRLARVSAGEGPVALPAYGCFDLATAAVGATAPIALYDLDPATLAPDLDSLTTVLAAGARIVVVAPIAGVPIPWDDVVQCAAAFGAVVVEDAAQGHGARWRDRPLGSLGALSVVSFGRGKGWTGGRGGAVLVRDRVLADFSRGLPLPEPRFRDELSVLAVSAALALLAHPNRYALPASIPWLHLGETRYREPNSLSGLSRSAAALLLASLAAADAEGAHRRTNARALLDALSERTNAARTITIPAEARAGYLRLPIRVTRASAVVHGLGGKRLGIANGYPSTLAEIPAVRSYLRTSGPLPGANALVRELITLPTHNLTTHRDRRAILDALMAAPHWSSPSPPTHEEPASDSNIL
ncbi:MAG TPA: DegT/DnrJ/EryC1/StrS family aminotransferase, partial [Gemmatimonadaceae bacterium]